MTAHPAGMAQIHLVRHGQASFDAADYDCLSPLGERQAGLLGEWFARCGRPAQLLARGSLRRHQQTADAFAASLPPALQPPQPVLVDARFDEFDHEAMLQVARPDLAGRDAMRQWLAGQPHPRRAFQQLFAEAMARWVSGRHDADYACSWQAFRERCMAALQQVADAAEGAASIVVVTSGGPISAICQQLLGLPADRACELCYGLANSGVTSLFHSRGRWSLGQLNSIAHLELMADPALVSYR